MAQKQPVEVTCPKQEPAPNLTATCSRHSTILNLLLMLSKMRASASKHFDVSAIVEELNVALGLSFKTSAFAVMGKDCSHTFHSARHWWREARYRFT